MFRISKRLACVLPNFPNKQTITSLGFPERQSVSRHERSSDNHHWGFKLSTQDSALS